MIFKTILKLWIKGHFLNQKMVPTKLQIYKNIIQFHKNIIIWE